MIIEILKFELQVEDLNINESKIRIDKQINKSRIMF